MATLGNGAADGNGSGGAAAQPQVVHTLPPIALKVFLDPAQRNVEKAARYASQKLGRDTRSRDQRLLRIREQVMEKVVGDIRDLGGLAPGAPFEVTVDLGSRSRHPKKWNFGDYFWVFMNFTNKHLYQEVNARLPSLQDPSTRRALCHDVAYGYPPVPNEGPGLGDPD